MVEVYGFRDKLLLEAMVRGYHHWQGALGCQREPYNRQDPFAVAVVISLAHTAVRGQQ